MYPHFGRSILKRPLQSQMTLGYNHKSSIKLPNFEKLRGTTKVKVRARVSFYSTQNIPMENGEYKGVLKRHPLTSNFSGITTTKF